MTKNIFILPTDKPSKLHLWSDENGTRLELCELEYSHTRNTQNIYITNNEEIKINDYITDGYLVWQWKDDSSLLGRKRVILTTDINLIKESVQAIDNEFLEWFVKNTSCDKVDVINKPYKLPYESGNMYQNCWFDKYKVVIPKKEPKCFDCQGTIKDGICFCNKETLEEATEKYLKEWRLLNNIHLSNNIHAERCKNDFKASVNWQAQRMYSEEEVLELLKKSHFVVQNIEEWFQQHKKN